MPYTKITPPSTSYDKILKQSTLYTKVSHMKPNTPYDKLSTNATSWGLITPNATGWTGPRALFPLSALEYWGVGEFGWSSITSKWGD